MRKVYLDTTQANRCISVFVNDAEVVLAGATVNAMSVKHKIMSTKNLLRNMIYILYLWIMFQK